MPAAPLRGHLRAREREQVRLETVEAFVQSRDPGPGLRRSQLAGRQLCSGGGERCALDETRQQVVALFEERQTLLVRLEAAGQEPPAFQLDKRRGDDQEFGGDLEVEPLHRLDLGEERVHDVGQGDLVEVDPLLGDEPQQQLERPGEDVGVNLVRHPA